MELISDLGYQSITRAIIQLETTGQDDGAFNQPVHAHNSFHITRARGELDCCRTLAKARFAENGRYARCLRIFQQSRKVRRTMTNDAHVLLADVAGQPVTGAPDTLALGEVPGWDSLKTVRLMVRLESQIGRELSEAELGGLQTVGDVRRLLAEGHA
jgi:acyl carrier protein